MKPVCVGLWSEAVVRYPTIGYRFLKTTKCDRQTCHIIQENCQGDWAACVGVHRILGIYQEALQCVWVCVHVHICTLTVGAPLRKYTLHTMPEPESCPF